jgi:DNA-binding NarL/FixJ family response regulator
MDGLASRPDPPSHAPGTSVEQTAIRVLVAHEEALIRAGIRSLLQALAGLEVVGEAASGLDALRLVCELDPDVAVVAACLPGLSGLDATLRAAKAHPRTRVLVLSARSDQEQVHRAFLTGASGLLLTSAEQGELEVAVRTVARGDPWLSPAASRAAVSAMLGSARPGAAVREPGPFELLTPRQREILQLIAEDNSTKEIAHRLGLSAKTVETHRAQLLRRLGVRGVAGLVRYALRSGLLRDPPAAELAPAAGAESCAARVLGKIAGRPQAIPDGPPGGQR